MFNYLYNWWYQQDSQPSEPEFQRLSLDELPSLQPQELPVEESNYTKLPFWSGDLTNCRILVIGKRKCGKSTLIESLSPTKSEWIPKDIRLNVWSLNTWLDLILRQQKVPLYNVDKEAVHKTICTDAVMFKTHRLENFYKIVPNFNLTMFIETQHPKFITPQYRAVTDFVFVFPDNSEESLESIVLNFNSPVELKQLKDEMAKLKPYQCLAWDTRSPKEALLYWCQAPNIDPTVI